MLEGQFIERQRIAEELHDNVGTKFSLLKIHAERLSRDSTAAVQTGLNTLLEQINQIKTTIRKVSHDLNPINLDKIRLEEAITDLCYDTEYATGIQVSFEKRLDIDTENLPLALRKAIYRTLAELINNAIKYAHPQHIKIAFSASSRNV